MRQGPPIACRLSGPREIGARRVLLGSVFEGAVRIVELDDGYAFEFPGSAGWSEKLLQIIDAERACCPFLAFALFFEPDGGPIKLRVTGPEGAKAFIEAELTPSGWTENG